MKKWSVLIAGLLAFAIFIFAQLHPRIGPRLFCNNNWNAAASMRTIVSAQEWFRDKDIDGNGKFEYWRRDIAGLYGLSQERQPIELIEISVALADARPDSEGYPDLQGEIQGPKAGFLYCALSFAGEVETLPDQWAAHAYPVSSDVGTYEFIASHEGHLYARIHHPDHPTKSFPVNPEKEGWERVEDLARRIYREHYPLWWLELKW